MMQLGKTFLRRKEFIQLGTYGHLGIFIWLLGSVMLFPQEKLLLTALICLSVLLVIYPTVFKRVINLRLFLFSFLMVLPPIFFVGEADRNLLGLAYSHEGVLVGLHAGLHFWIVLLAVHGLTQSVDIPSLAGTLERFRLQGLGFAIGVAINLIPNLKDAAIKSWFSLKMRGGFRKQWFRGVQLYLVVVITNALRQAEDIALAAEARAFSPEKSRPMAIKRSKIDRLVIPFLGITFIIAMVYL